MSTWNGLYEGDIVALEEDITPLLKESSPKTNRVKRKLIPGSSRRWSRSQPIPYTIEHRGKLSHNLYEMKRTLVYSNQATITVFVQVRT